MAPMQPGGVVAGPRIPRGETETINPAREQTIEDRLRERTILGFAAGVVVGVSWMLLVLFVSDRLVG